MNVEMARRSRAAPLNTLIAEQACEAGATTLRSIGHIAKLHGALGNDADFVDQSDLSLVLRDDHADLMTRLTAAEALSQRQRYMMATAGHDLKQPLQVILMVVDRLLPRLSAKDRAYADIALAEIGRLAGGLNELAGASLGSACDVVTPNLESISVSQLMEDVAASWGLHAAAKGLQIRVASSRLGLVSDRCALETILRNLIGNAVKYTSSGGVLVGCRRRAGGLRIEVWDTGPGIAFEDLPHILSPFYQINESCDGLGLGLAIARHSAGLIGATIEVESRVGRGSRFALCWPADAQAGQV